VKLLVGYDGSPFARHALDRVISFAAAKPKVYVATAVERGPHTADLVSQKRLLEEAKALLLERQIECETLELVGDPADELISAAKQIGADVILVGTRGRSGAASLLLGSVSTKLAREAPCDVLIAR
jgi:nucleotide-binding universal stress UspA family protein